MRIWWREIDRVLLGLVLIVMAMGTLAVAVASPASADRLSNAAERLPDLYFLWLHLRWQALGLLALLAVSTFPKDMARRAAILLTMAMVIALVLVPLIGQEVNGARRWLRLGVAFQPSEFLKPAFAVALAWILSWRLRDPNLPVLAISGAAMALVAGLLMAQPDFGSTVLFFGVWFVLVVVGVVAMRRPSAPWRPVAAVVAAPLVMILALVAKNAVLYGEPTLTTFAGPSLAKIAGSAATPAEREALQADGTVSELFGRPVFWGYETYADAMAPCERDRPDVPVLAEPDRPVGGYPNMNDECMLAVYRVQTDDAEAYVRAEPRRFAAAQLGGAQMFFEPALPIIFTTNADELEPLDDLYAATLLRSVQLQPVTRTEFGELRVLSAGGIDLVPTVVALDLAAVALGLRAAARLVARRDRRGGEAARTELGAWAAVGLTCAWVTAVGSLLEVNENARYRQLIEPFLLLVLAWLGQQAWQWW